MKDDITITPLYQPGSVLRISLTGKLPVTGARQDACCGTSGRSRYPLWSQFIAERGFARWPATDRPVWLWATAQHSDGIGPARPLRRPKSPSTGPPEYCPREKKGPPQPQASCRNGPGGRKASMPWLPGLLYLARDLHRRFPGKALSALLGVRCTEPVALGVILPSAGRLAAGGIPGFSGGAFGQGR